MATFYIPASQYLPRILGKHNLPGPEYVEGVNENRHFVCSATVAWLSDKDHHEVSEFTGEHPHNPIIAKDLAAIAALKHLMAVHHFMIVDIHYQELVDLKSKICSCNIIPDPAVPLPLHESCDVGSFFNVASGDFCGSSSGLMGEFVNTIKGKGKEASSPICETNFACEPTSLLKLTPEILKSEIDSSCLLGFTTGLTTVKKGESTCDPQQSGNDYLTEVLNLRALVKQSNKELLKMNTELLQAKLRTQQYQQGRRRFMKFGRDFRNSFKNVDPVNGMPALMRMAKNFLHKFKDLESSDNLRRYNPRLQPEDPCVTELFEEERRDEHSTTPLL